MQPSTARRIPVSFDDETFLQVRELALRAHVSFAQQIRELVEFGLEAIALPDQERRPRAATARVEKR